MISIFINGVNRSTDASVELDSLSISENFQRRATSCSFSMLKNKPSEYQEVVIYEHVLISSLSSNTLVIKDKTISGDSIWSTNLFRVGNTLYADIGGDNEKMVISDINQSTNTITLVDNVVGTFNEDELVGIKIFGGVVTTVSDQNLVQLTNLIYNVQCTDYTKLFDKALINESYEDRTSLYITVDAVNNFINLNELIEDMEYTNVTALRAEWVETGDGDNPLLETIEIREGNTSAEFPWTYSGGMATFTGTPSNINIEYLTGAASGTPLEGILAFWYKQVDNTAVTSIEVRIGSDSSNYVKQTFTPEADNDFHYKRIDLVDMTVVGTPDWTDITHLEFIITETADSSIYIDGVRINETGSFTFDNVNESSTFDNFNMRRQRPSKVMQLMADVKGFFWYIDYDKDIHFYEQATNPAPFGLSNNSDNFDKLTITVDSDQLVNQQVVHGGLATSAATYEQNTFGDGQMREWILKSQFVNLEVFVDNNTVTDLAEAGTTTTTINATGHGLTVGDYITNRTAGSEVREVLTVPDPDSFTVAAVTGQTNGDTFSIFSSKSVGLENIADETTVDYVSDFNNRSVRATDSETTLTTDGIIKFKYNEKYKISIQRKDNASITRMQTLIGGTGIFDGEPITNQSILTQSEAADLADAQLRKYSNPIVNAKFTTDWHGLHAGQLISIIDTERGLNDTFLIQSLTKTIRNGDYSVYTVNCASTLFGIIELFQKLLDRNENDNFDEVVIQLENADENIYITEGFSYSLGNAAAKWGSDPDQGIWSQFQWS